jgi:GNAT superfamily N-acetyltransferase
MPSPSVLSSGSPCGVDTRENAGSFKRRIHCATLGDWYLQPQSEPKTKGPRAMPDHHNSTIEVDTDQSRLDLETIHVFLTDSYWARGVPLEVVERSIRGSLCFGLYDGNQQIGFARVISDCATFAYLADIFVLESHRGRGLGKTLMRAVVAHPSLQGLRRWLLATRDAHELYAQFGFAPLAAPDRFMERHKRDVYASSDSGPLT